MRGKDVDNSRGAKTNQRSRLAKRSTRGPEAILFARDQRSGANQFARDLWEIVRNRRYRNQKFRREHLIPSYKTDVCRMALKLVIEVDGKHHQTDEGRRHDQQRDQFLTEQGYAVVRIAGYDVLQDAAGVRRLIEHAVDQQIQQRDSLTPSPSPSS